MMQMEMSLKYCSGLIFPRKHDTTTKLGFYLGKTSLQLLQGRGYGYGSFTKCSLHGDSFPCVQTLSNFPKDDLLSRTILLRFDSDILLAREHHCKSPTLACFTIHYLFQAGAKVVLLSHWNPQLPLHSVADSLSSLLQLKVGCISSFDFDAFQEADVLLLQNLSGFKEELANSTKFAQILSSKIDIFVNDSFSQSHKILASTVAIARFCYASLAGFLFEEGLSQLNKAAKTNNNPYVAIIGGGNLYDKAAALHFLASRCDGLVFVGMMAFQIMHAMGLNVPSNLVDHGAVKEANYLMQFAQSRKIPIFYPKVFLCMNIRLSDQLQLFPAHGILDGWVPVDIGPNSLDEISCLLAKSKRIIWIGPMKFKLPKYNDSGTNTLVSTLDKLSQNSCDITIVGTAACKAVMSSSCSPSVYHMIETATVFWEFLKGKKLHGLLALDRAYLHEIDWQTAYSNPAQPLVVDIGSGNGMFLLEMASMRKDLNFLGLEINHKLVRRCEDSVQQAGVKNVYFIATNATSTFRSIVSSYLGELVLVSILCPNPDFEKPEYRWRMLQRSLIEAVADLLKSEGMVYLQSDVEGVAMRMKEEFLKHCKDKLSVVHEQDYATFGEGWLMDNPFGVRSDWEQHVIDRGAPMYRLLLSKSSSGLAGLMLLDRRPMKTSMGSKQEEQMASVAFRKNYAT